VLDQSGKLRVISTGGENLSVANRNGSSAFAFQRPDDDVSPAAPALATHNFVYEMNEIIRQSYDYSCAHYDTVPAQSGE
jgi:hypothetical protein